MIIHRIVENVNTHTTIQQLINHMHALNPDHHTGAIMYGQPPQLVSNHDQTVEEAGLLNEIIMQQ